MRGLFRHRQGQAIDVELVDGFVQLAGGGTLVQVAEGLIGNVTESYLANQA